MSAPGFPPFAPPLPPGWTEHLGPTGVKYYYNGMTQESTYVRPLPPPPAAAKSKKEKPSTKTPIPGTDWLRVKTNEGNIFYFRPSDKVSKWTVPPEIKDAVDALEREEKAILERPPAPPVDAAEEERNREVARVKAEVETLVKRKADDGGNDDSRASKKAKVEREDDSESSDEEDDGPQEDWEKEAAEQLAAEAKEADEERRANEEARKIQAKVDEELAKRQRTALNIPDRVDLSLDEAKALFKTLLREKDINPLHPWDKCLPLFVSDPRYVLLPSVTARRDAFDEYCRERAREIRAQNATKEKEVVDPKVDYERLLTAEVTSTRASWTEFKRTWKKNRRFYGWGRDDREREKRFRDFLKELGEKKRAASQKAEAEFFTLLKESHISLDSEWKDAKRPISRDPRYDAVGSSSLREELFKAFKKAQLGNVKMEDVSTTGGDEKPAKQTESVSERKARALREREEKVKTERSRMEANIDRSRNELNKEEGEREFNTLLTDAIREPQMSWDDAMPQLQTDPRFTNSKLPMNQQLHLFHSHIGHLRERHINGLYALFEAHAPTLATKFDALPMDSLSSSLPVTKLGYGERQLMQEFDKWQRERTTNARSAFDEMLSENAFVEFWGRLGKIGGEGVDGGVKADEMEEDEGEGGGGKVDMKALAKNVDVEDMEKVLKNDKRYIMFAHVPEQREKWVRDYLGSLSAPKLSVHVAQ